MQSPDARIRGHGVSINRKSQTRRTGNCKTWLRCLACTCAYCSPRAPPACRFLTGALEDVAKSSGISEEFLGLIVLPIAGNACEHITAVFVAVKDKMDLAIGVALGSSIQVGISPAMDFDTIVTALE